MWYEKLKIKKIQNDDILKKESIHPGVMELLIRDLTYFMITDRKKDAFALALNGFYAERHNYLENFALANEYLDDITGLDDMSLQFARYLIQGEIWNRLGTSQDPEKVKMLTKDDIHNIRVMVTRCLEFTSLFCTISYVRFHDLDDVYRNVIELGHGNVLGRFCLWMIKTSKKKPTQEQFFQLLQYYILGKHFRKEQFRFVDKIGIFNPRLNAVFQLKINDLDDDILNKARYNLIHYEPKSVDVIEEILYLASERKRDYYVFGY